VREKEEGKNVEEGKGERGEVSGRGRAHARERERERDRAASRKMN
jgi:hypothetical protein